MTEPTHPEGQTGSDEPLLTRYLHGRDEACPRCGYNLRMLTGDRCPECGDRLRLRVGLVEARMGAYISAVVGSCLGFGGALFFMVLVLCYAPLDYWRQSGAPWVMSVQVLVTGLVLAVLLFKRRTYTKRPRKAQVWYTVLVWLLTVGFSVVSLMFFQD